MKKHESAGNGTKKYKVGFFGGKFIPFHLGHLYCVKRASEECEKVYLVLFYGGDQEEQILSNPHPQEWEMESRRYDVFKVALSFNNVIPKCIDVTHCKKPDGTEDWDAETPLVLDAIGRMDAVYSSEPGYDEYFKRAYPWATHILVDPPRIVYPISGTKIRSMKTEKERKKWRI